MDYLICLDIKAEIYFTTKYWDMCFSTHVCQQLVNQANTHTITVAEYDGGPIIGIVKMGSAYMKNNKIFLCVITKNVDIILNAKFYFIALNIAYEIEDVKDAIRWTQFSKETLNSLYIFIGE